MHDVTLIDVEDGEAFAESMACAPDLAVIEDAIARAKTDPGAPFETTVVNAALRLSTANMAAFVRARNALRGVGNVSITLWEDHLRATQTAHKAARRAEFATRQRAKGLNGHAATNGTPVLESYPFTDVANAARFVTAHRHALRFCIERGWYHDAGTRWVHGDLKELDYAQRTARELAREATNTLGDESGERVARGVLSGGAVGAMVQLARPHIACRLKDFDRDPWVLNCENGVVDLRAGTLREHRAEDLLTKQCPVAFDPDATCPVFDGFLARVLPDPEVRAFVRRLAGSWLTGVVREHVLPIFYGRGRNGKSTFLEALQFVLGDYARAVPADVLMEAQSDKHPTEKAQFLGLRFAVASESEQGRTLAESTVKQLTGGDTITARYMHQDFFSFEPTHKLAMCTNHKPRIKGTDEGIWSRVLLVCWGVTIPEAERDTTLGVRLRAEAAGILAWILRGCLDWQEQGLDPPESVRIATREFRAESDLVGRFLEERCVRREGLKTAASALYAAFEAWCRAGGERACSGKVFGQCLVDDHGIERKAAASGRWYIDLGLQAEGGSAPDDD